MNNTSSPLKILVADQQELIASGLKQLFKTSNAYEIVAHADTGINVLDWLSKNYADILLIDVSLPEMDGIDTTRAVHKAFPKLLIIAHSLLREIEYVNSMLIEGASAYVLKGADMAEFDLAFERVLSGKRYLSPLAQQSVDQGYSHTAKRFDGEYLGLTSREREIIKLIAQEKTNIEIADTLFLNIETIRTYRKSLMTKLNVRNAAGLVKYAVDRCWI